MFYDATVRDRLMPVAIKAMHTSSTHNALPDISLTGHSMCMGHLSRNENPGTGKCYCMLCIFQQTFINMFLGDIATILVRSNSILQS